MAEWFFIPVAYLLGSLSSAVIVSKACGLPDPREEGSKNPGATNVLRLGGKKAAAITLAGDAAKGLIPVLLAKALGFDAAVLAAVGLAAFLGHLFPVFFGFKGGKGVATALGVLSGFSWLVGLAVLLTWVVVAFVSRISSLSALVAAGLAPFYVWFLIRSESLAAATAAMALLLVWRHRGNIDRLLKGQESRIGSKA
jgi:glycerol-3-phosphate acyltransferase PlsY